MNTTNLQFSLRSNTIPVTLGSGEGETPVQYELREMTAATRDKYLDKLAQRMNLDPAGKASGLKKFDGMQAELISMCLYRKEGEDGQEGASQKPVPISEIQTWPSSVVSGLYMACSQLNHLAMEEEPAAPKNE